MVDEPFSEGFSFVRKGEGFFETGTGLSERLHGKGDSFVVEIYHYVFETLALFSDEIFDGNLEIENINTLTSSKVMKVVPLDHMPWHFIFRVVTPGVFRGMRIRESSFLEVRQAVVK